MVAVIIACEVGFWVLLGCGLAARYVLRAKLLSTVLLLAVPLLGIVRVGFEFTGKAAHASADPWEGVNALDAAVQTYNNAAQTIPTNIIAGMMGFKTRSFFEVAEGERGPVQVRF